MTPEEIDLQAWQQWWDQRTTIHVSQEDYDHLIQQLNQPPQSIPSIKQLLERKSPWDEHKN